MLRTSARILFLFTVWFSFQIYRFWYSAYPLPSITPCVNVRDRSAGWKWQDLNLRCLPAWVLGLQPSSFVHSDTRPLNTPISEVLVGLGDTVRTFLYVVSRFTVLSCVVANTTFPHQHPTSFKELPHQSMPVLIILGVCRGNCA